MKQPSTAPPRRPDADARSVAAWCRVLLFMSGAIGLVVTSLLEVAQRLLELGRHSSGALHDELR